MNAHEIIDRMAAKSPRAKVITGLVAVGLLIAVVFGVMYVGHRVFSGWADSKYLRESEERGKKIAVLETDAARHEANEAQLAAENDLLKKQNAAMAEAQKIADTDRERKALADLAKREAERTDKFGEIDANTDYDSQLCLMCAEFRASGFPLSDKLCGRCEVPK